MGGSESKNSAYEESIALFSQTERDQISGIYNWMVESAKNGFTQGQLQSYVKDHMTTMLAVRLHHYMLHLGKTSSSQSVDHVKYEEFAIAMAHLLKGTLEQKASVMSCFCNGLSETTVAKGRLIKSWKFTSPEPVRSFAEFLISEQHQENDGSSGYDITSKINVETWMTRCALCHHLFDYVMHKCFPVTFVDGYSGVANLLPSAMDVPWDKFFTLLTLPALLLITQSLPSECRSPWKLLFSSRLHGESFTMMSKKIMNRGPSVLLVQDTKGHLFGGFIGQSLEHSGQFVGNDCYFLFHLSPTIGVYPATGLNKNYLYFNQGQETLPNGLGMGGQFGYFGLWLDYEYGRGHSKAQPKSTTYGSPQLSADEDFEIDTIEVWHVGPEHVASNDDEDVPTSILDKDPEAKAMLSLIDKGPLSEGLRESDPTADTPAEHTLRPPGFY